MRVLIVNKFHYPKGGSETYYFSIAAGLKAMGHEVAFFSTQDARNLPCDQDRYFVSPSDYSGGGSISNKIRAGLTLAYSPEARDKFERLLENFRPDVIHLNLVHRQITLSILDASSARDVPVVYTAHDYIPICPSYTMLDGREEICDACLDGHYLHCLERRCVKSSWMKSGLAAYEAFSIRRHGSYDRIDRFIAPSSFMKEKLIEGGFPSHKIVVMQNFVQKGQFEQAKTTSSVRRAKEFLYFGRLSYEKGVDLLLEAFAIAIKEGLDEGWFLVIAGDGPERTRLEMHAQELGIAGRVSFVGLLSKTQVTEAVSRCSFAVTCSRWRENMPYSIIEAFSAGTPVIGANIGGIPELVIEGQTGFLCHPNDATSLAKSMLCAAHISPTAYASLSRGCRRYVRERCDQTSYMKCLVGLYQELIKSKPENRD